MMITRRRVGQVLDGRRATVTGADGTVFDADDLRDLWLSIGGSVADDDCAPMLVGRVITDHVMHAMLADVLATPEPW